MKTLEMIRAYQMKYIIAFLILSGITFTASGTDTNKIIHAATDSLAEDKEYPVANIIHPFDSSVFPPDMVAPTFLWNAGSNRIKLWLFEVFFISSTNKFYSLNTGTRSEPTIDLAAKNSATHNFSDPIAMADYEWTPDENLWNQIKAVAKNEEVRVTLYGLDVPNEYSVMSKTELHFSISPDPVNSPIFYRDVPLLPEESHEGKIKPIPTDALPLIEWKLRDISKQSPKIVLQQMPTCVNCHSFSRDGAVLGMDMDGPNGDKGAYAITPTSKDIVIEDEDIISWNSYKDTPEGHNNFGLFSQVSPDGRYVVSTLNEDVFIVNYKDISFVQSFYPTKGILVAYDRETGEMNPLPGGSDTNYVQSNAVWSPDGKELIFSRAPAKEAYGGTKLPTYAGDPLETPIQYDLYRIPFNNGKGGEAKPVIGASKNGMSNSFPKYSPNGKWIVYVQASKGQLMRPDSKLYIIPTAGGEARELDSNLSLMNSWHSWSPNSKWLVFSSKGFGPYTKMFLTHIDEEGNATPPVLIPKSTADNRAVNIPEFINGPGDVISSISAPSQRSYKLFKKAMRYVEAEKWDEALPLVNESLEINPYYPPANQNKGFILLRMGKHDEALIWFKKAHELDPKMEQASNAVAHILRKEGRVNEAIAYLDSILKKDPSLPRTQLMIAELYKTTGQAVKVVEHCRAAATLSIFDPKYYVLVGSLLYDENMLEDAAGCYEQSLHIDASQSETIYLLGLVYRDQGKSLESAKLFAKAIELDGRLDARYELARLKLTLNQIDEAAMHLEKVLISQEDAVDARMMLAGIYDQQKRTEESEKQYRLALEFEPNHIAALTQLAILLATNTESTEADYKEALGYAQKACELTGNKQAASLHALAIAYAANGEFKQAVAIDEKVLQLPQTKNSAFFSELVNKHIKLFKANKPVTQETLKY